MSSTRAISAGSLLLLLAGGLWTLSFGYTEMAGSDMWWHIAAGRELVQTGTPWMLDDWSFSAHGHPWHNHEWLADLLYYAWVSAFGVPSLVYWKWLLILATYMLLLVTLARVTGSWLAALPGAALAVALAAPFLDIRPHLYSLLCYSVLLYGGLARQPRLYWLLPLFVLWVNLHGGFFFGLMALGILLFPWRAPRPAALGAALAVGLACLLATALNPAGLKAVLYPLGYAFDGSSPYRQLSEWLSPFVAGGIRSPLFFYVMWMPLLGLAYLLPAVRRAADVPFEGIALTLLTLAMALTSRRFIPLFGMSLALLLSPLVALLVQRLRLERHSLALGSVLLLCALYRLLPYSLQAAPNFHYLTAEYSYPVDMLNFIEANDIRGNVYAFYNWGGYVHWRTDGALRVFIDGRADTVYDAATYRHYVTVLGSGPGWVRELEATDADYLLWPLRRGHGQEKLAELLATGRWRPVYADAVSFLLARAEQRQAGEVRPSQAGPWQELAAAHGRYREGDVTGALEHARAAHSAMPWHQGACNLLMEGYAQQADEARMRQVYTECRHYFPSRYIRAAHIPQRP